MRPLPTGRPVGLSLVSVRRFQKRQPMPRRSLSLIVFPCMVVVNGRLTPTTWMRRGLYCKR